MLLPLLVSRCWESKTGIGVGFLEILEAGVRVGVGILKFYGVKIGSKSSDFVTLIKIAMVYFTMQI